MMVGMLTQLPLPLLPAGLPRSGSASTNWPCMLGLAAGRGAHGERSSRTVRAERESGGRFDLGLAVSMSGQCVRGARRPDTSDVGVRGVAAGR